MSSDSYTTSGEAPHKCPVCGETYIPGVQSRRIPGSGWMEVTIDGVGCIKGTDDWLRFYDHHAVRIAD